MEQKSKKGKKKSGRTKTLLWMLVILAVIIGAAILIPILSNREENSTEEEEEDLLLSLVEDSVFTLDITYQEESYTLSRPDAASDWSIEGVSLPVDQTYPEEITLALSELAIQRNLGSVNKADYGLSPATGSLTIHREEGEEDVSLDIGLYNASTEGYYVTLNGGEEVYMVSSSLGNAVCHGMTEVLSWDEIPSFTNLSGMEFTSDTGKIVLTYEPDGRDTVYTREYVWFYDGPDASGDNHPASSDASNEVASLLTELELQEICALSPEDLAGYGLDNPVLSVRVDYATTETQETGETDEDGNAVTEDVDIPAVFELSLGNSFTDENENECIYCSFPSGSDTVYSLLAEDVSSLLTLNYTDVAPTDVLFLDWETVDSFLVKTEEKSHDITLSWKTTTDEDGNETETAVYTEEDTSLDTTLTENFVEFLSNLVAESTVDDSENEGELLMEILFRRNTGDEWSEMTFTLRSYDSNFCRVSFGGFDRVLISRKDAEELLLYFDNIR